MVVSSLQAERSSDQARRILEKETDRLMYRAAQETVDSSRSQAVQGILQVVKNTLPFLESVTETEVWEKSLPEANGGRMKIPVPGIIALIAGLFCASAGLFGQSSAGNVIRPGAVLWTLAGCALVAAGGYMAGRRSGTGSGEGSRRGRGSGEGSSRGRGSGKGSSKGRGYGSLDKQAKQTFLVDPAQVWHVLQGIALTADHSLEEAEEYAKLADSGEDRDPYSILSKDEMSFFADLLENAYARERNDPQDPALREQVESIRYYLHTRGIETEDYAEEHAGWFEILPSGGGRATIRPAMLHDGVPVRKGLAVL